jgi:hypothetical protein
MTNTGSLLCGKEELFGLLEPVVFQFESTAGRTNA